MRKEGIWHSALGISEAGIKASRRGPLQRGAPYRRDRRLPLPAKLQVRLEELRELFLESVTEREAGDLGDE